MEKDCRATQDLLAGARAVIAREIDAKRNPKGW